ncbi:Chaperone protein DnaJ [Cyphellophora attinorum]|uniref:Chaperone protein DnaJ n=1 Tax=Cyphellophora attinorum TaxID=1664694 RepID=A0A0N0NN10_9EURO|nr:Chaperone protein DnaJ [Phialophora attinorum]KPI40839.1 Chaperone protein DnaJ [Phialophora attinorum]
MDNNRFDVREDYYTILGISYEDASDEAKLKQSYHKLAKALHPDKTGQSDSEPFKQVLKAYEVLKDATVRRAYDNARRSQQSQPSSGAFEENNDATRRAPGKAETRFQSFFKPHFASSKPTHAQSANTADTEAWHFDGPGNRNTPMIISAAVELLASLLLVVVTLAIWRLVIAIAAAVSLLASVAVLAFMRLVIAILVVCVVLGLYLMVAMAFAAIIKGLATPDTAKMRKPFRRQYKAFKRKQRSEQARAAPTS